MSKRAAWLIAGILGLVFWVFVFAAILPGAASDVQGYSDCTDVPQVVFTEVPLPNTDIANDFCREGSETDREFLGCAVYSGTTRDDYCTIYYPEGDEYVRRHECTHCRDGAFHE